MRKCFISLLLILAILVSPVSLLSAADPDNVDIEVVIGKANQLKDLLDHLLLDSNHSSIQKVIKEGDEPTKALIAEAFRLKTSGEKLLSEQKYMDAAVSLQAALDHVFKAIRQADEQVQVPDVVSAKLAENIKVNDTFITTAARVVSQEQDRDALNLLAMAKEARSRADTESGKGRNEAAILELEHSTRLAQQAIMKVRNGKVIERMQ